MMPDEAKLLRPGDYVLAMVRVDQNCPSSIRIATHYIKHSDITEKLRPMPSRHFRKGDIVSYGEALRYVINDQDRFGVLIASEEPAEYGHMVDAADLTLICAAENRADMNAEETAAAPQEVDNAGESAAARGASSGVTSKIGGDA